MHIMQHAALTDKLHACDVEAWHCDFPDSMGVRANSQVHSISITSSVNLMSPREALPTPPQPWRFTAKQTFSNIVCEVGTKAGGARGLTGFCCHKAAVQCVKKQAEP
eukprot:254937-Amphidinium_carterae.1